MSESWIRVCPTCYSDELQVVTNKEGHEPELRYWCPNCGFFMTIDELEYGAKKE